MTQWTDKDNRVADIMAAARQAMGGDPALLTFMEILFDNASPEDLQSGEVERFLALGRYLWSFGEQRRQGQTLLHVFNPKQDTHGWDSGHTAIAIINDDMPFLMDSITGFLGVTKRLRLHAVHHPIIRVNRDQDGCRTGTISALDYTEGGARDKSRESIIYVEIDRQSDVDALKEIETGLADVLGDVRLAVSDWKAMVAKIDETVASLTVCPPPIDDKLVQETIRFLRWLSDDSFTFLGYRDYRFDGTGDTRTVVPVAGSGRGILRDDDRHILRGRSGLGEISDEILAFLRAPEQPVIITKANVKARVHRPVHMDYVGVKIYDEEARVIGERRFVGLFTSLAYATAAADTPLLRLKVNNVRRRTSFDARSHAGKNLSHILETFPRDELFQIEEDALFDTALGILHLSERPRPHAFIRRDKFGRFASVLVYVPRENYHSGLREKVAHILCEGLNGEVSVYYAQLSDDVLARWHFIIRTQPDTAPVIDEQALNDRIIEVAKGWEEHLRDLMADRHGEERAHQLLNRWMGCFSMGYREDFEPHRAVNDIEKLDELQSRAQPVTFAVYRRVGDDETDLRMKLYGGEGVVPLTRCLPMLEHTGFEVISENAHILQGSGRYCIQDFYLRWPDGPIGLEHAKGLLEPMFYEIFTGASEDDWFNGLALRTGLTPKKIIIMRAYTRYLRQLGLPFGLTSLAQMLTHNAAIVKNLMALFECRFNPDFSAPQDRQATQEKLKADILTALDGVESLDHDRLLRGLLSAILATLRTNYYGEFGDMFEDGLHTALAFKIRTGDLPEAPQPRPWAEIFVHSERVEGVHLRGGPVARGGLRWSDRPEDFRTEVLGLVKAQQVKNAVIVPVGAKGGFVPRRSAPDREARQAEGIACYKIFINSLLSVTDNLDGQIVLPPPAVVRHDGDDPYLVVAADKGTATFSDISNGLAVKRGFWLGDAFASGGSAGYDHKKMGITARGAWVSVQRHFRERGINVQTDPISVIGIGDMSGDVFGNGLLLSKTLKLKAAFNHLHIFLDPDPDPEASWAERQRLFDLPRSGWADYDKSLISKGGGIFDRQAKSIALSDEVRAFLKVQDSELTPAQLINRILKAEADLLWFGGIGTYVKARDEAHADAGDRANDILRVDADELKVKAVGEGGNLGMTQRARIDFASVGGRLNTDFIDNSAGVDCSDKEVNIKILLTEAIAGGRLALQDRDALLEEMTDAVAGIVLADNYLQTQAISIAEMLAPDALELHAGLMRTLEREGSLDRALEFLPSEDRLSELQLSRKGLTRPEIAVLVAYAKMSLEAILNNSPVMDDPVLQPELEASFPPLLRDRFATDLQAHRLRRELVATVTANEVVNRGGLTFVYEVREETGLGVEQIVAAFIASRDVAGLSDLWARIDALDFQVAADLQMRMHVRLSEFIKHQAIWFLRNTPQPLDIPRLVGAYTPGLNALLDNPEAVLSPILLEAFGAKIGRLEQGGVPTEIARRVSALTVFTVAADIVDVAQSLSRPVADVGKAYFEVGDRIGFDWLRQASEAADIDDHWDRLARQAVLDDLADQQRNLTRDMLAASADKPAHEAVEAWVGAQEMTLIRTDRLQGDLRSSGLLSVAKLSFAARHLRSILTRARAELV